MRHVYGNRFAETDEEKLFKQDIVELQQEVERWRRIAQQTPVPIVVEHGEYTEIVGHSNLILQDKQSKLHKAIRTIVKAHTRDDRQMGFTVEGSPMIDPFSEVTCDEYIEAWRMLRKEIHEQTEPEIC